MTKELYTSDSAKMRFYHFANLVSLAASDGQITELEENLLRRFKRKLSISDSDYEKIMKDPSGYSILSIGSKDQRLEYLYDLLKVIYVDGVMDEVEALLIKRYAIGLGYSEAHAAEILKKSIKLFSGAFSFDAYQNYVENDF
ncbi:tellurite resistance TerB-like protein [Psychroflexus sp. S27]|uniref:TerB family tellurite resistance protein n=1 Tax=Psychroflexus sp. S27 TaxID=1982757 RepID=UPI000C2A6C54|nr:TerB family tellurite resistance protein [Psychroflexus sp. S27]PJX27566.1 tellurite resistance TerB-like protein [Psychroflexus sp. S27]